MVKIKWKGKKERNEISSKAYETRPFQNIDIYQFPKHDYKIDNNGENLLIWGENKAVMNSLLRKFEKKISLIYIDPPFATGGDYNLKIQIGEGGNFLNNIAYTDKWGAGLDSYLNFLYERLILMRRLLTNQGSIYIHLDWHISHYVKVIMDEIFGIENFRNEIIWAYPAASVKTRRFFIRSYDIILFYSKSDNFIFNDDPDIYMEYSNRVKNALKKDEQGIFYYRGGSHNGKKLSRKVYVENKGIFPRDVWNDIPYIRANTLEYQGFSTQKPERLLKRIILASTNKCDIVADFFSGSGTTLAVAEKLGRHWIGCDINKHAVHMARKRILNLRESNDILNWKKRYQRDPSSFKIFTIEKGNGAIFIPPVFLKNTIKEESILKMNKRPDLDVQIHQNDNKVEIELIDYKVPFINLISDKVQKKLKSFSDFIDYWAIDFDYNNDNFKNMWFSYRIAKSRIISLKSKAYKYNRSGIYNILIKTIDIFGIESLTKFEVKIT